MVPARESGPQGGVGRPLGEPSLREPSPFEPTYDALPAALGRRRPTRMGLGRVLYRVGVAVLGGVTVLVGLVLVPAPGPGWLVVFAGLALLATEFAWARRLLVHVRRRVARATAWTARQGLGVRALLGLGSAAVCLGLLWAVLAVMGVPGWLPDVLENTVQAYVPGT